MNKVKRISVLLLTVLLTVTLFGCGKDDDVIFRLNDYKVHKKDVDIFGLIYVMEHSLVDDDMMDEVYENGETYAEHYKNELEQDLVLAVLLDREADSKGFALPDDEKEKAEELTTRFMDKFGEGKLNDFDIDRSEVKKIFEMKLRGDSYASSDYDVSEVEKESEDEGNDEERYIRVFEVMFPTVIFDDSGIMRSDKNGDPIRPGQTEIDEMKLSAEDFCDKVHGGQKMEDLLKDEPYDVTGEEKTLKYSDLSEEYKAGIDGLTNGGVSDVITGEYGYYVVRMIDPDDDEHAGIIEGYEVQKEMQAAKQKLFDKLFNDYVGDDKEYRNDELWDNISIRDYTG